MIGILVDVSGAHKKKKKKNTRLKESVTYNY